MIKREDLYNMSLHTRVEVDSQTTVLRVEGGWIYTFIGLSKIFNTSTGGYSTTTLNPTSTFIPEVKI